MGLFDSMGSLFGSIVGGQAQNEGYGKALGRWDNANITAANPWATYTEDPEAKQYQRAALQNLQRVAAPGGDIQARADIQKNLMQGAAQARGTMQQALQQQAAQGTVGGGQQLAAAQGAAQNQATANALGTADASGAGYLRGLQAMAQGGQQAGVARGQQQAYQQAKLGGTSDINRFNAQQQLQKTAAQSELEKERGIARGKNLMGTAQAGAGFMGGIASLGK